MENLQVFQDERFGNIRGTEINSERWIVGKDVCVAVGDKNHIRSLGRLDDVDKCKMVINDSMGRKQEVTLINESGFYSLLFAMQPQKANKDGVSDAYPIETQKRIEFLRAFKHWVTAEVLPSIRKTGGYIAGQETMSDAELMAKAVLVAQRTIAERDKRIAALEEKAAIDAPKVLFAESVEASEDTILIGELAKILKQNGVDTGEKRLFAWLRANGYLIKRKGRDHNMPTQFAMERGLFRIKECTTADAGGSERIRKTTTVTATGQKFFVNLFLADVQVALPCAAMA